MYLIVDVQYNDEAKTGSAAGILFRDPATAVEAGRFTVEVENVAEYIPGEFYKRELPCILQLLAAIDTTIATIIIDGFVDLEPGHPGLGRHLYNATGIPVIGIAKSRYDSAVAEEVYRGHSKKSLLVTSTGDVKEAAELVKNMNGEHRLPTLVTRVDQLCRG